MNAQEILSRLLAAKIVKPAKKFRVNGTPSLVEGCIVRGHETMGVVIAPSGEWTTIFVEGIRWGSFPGHEGHDAVAAFLRLTWESTDAYARAELAKILGSSAKSVGTATVSLSYDLIESYLDTEAKRREHLRGIRLESCFHVITLTVGGVAHHYENRAEGWIKLNARTLAQIEAVRASVGGGK